MKKAVKAVLLLMVMLTVVYFGAVVYVYTNSTSRKSSIEYRLLKDFFAERLGTEPQEWNTTEELGITFGEKLNNKTYDILVVDEEKALLWMNGTEPQPYATKYNDEFYRIGFIWVDYGSENNFYEVFNGLQVPIGGALGVGWVSTGILAIKNRDKKLKV